MMNSQQENYLFRLINYYATRTKRWIRDSGVNGKPVHHISFRLGRNDEIRKEYLRTSY